MTDINDTLAANEMSRDNFCQALADLYDYDPHEFDGYSLAELSQVVSVSELEHVCRYLGIE